MRIAMISTPFVPVPPIAYGGTELIVDELVQGLRALGHDVVLYTTGVPESRDVRCLYRTPVWPPDAYHEMQHVAWALADAAAGPAPADVIHSHCAAALPLARFVRTPIVYTIHHHRTEPHATIYGMQEGVRFVAISARQRALHAEIATRCEVIHHGLDAARYPLGPGGPGAVFLGRLSRVKGPHAAIDVARRAGCPLVVAGRAHAGDELFFERELRPRLAEPHVTYLGEAKVERKARLLGEARATLFPIEWEEPFGLVMIESMLAGTPVLAFPHGSVPEVIDEGVTGFICGDEAEMAARLAELPRQRFDRRRCHARAVERFGRARMVREYLDVYARAVVERAGARAGGATMTAAGTGAAE